MTATKNTNDTVFVKSTVVKDTLIQTLHFLHTHGVSEVGCRVYIILAGCSDDYDPARMQIATWSGLSIAQVSLGVLELEDLSYIKKTRVGIKGKYNNKYSLLGIPGIHFKQGVTCDV